MELCVTTIATLPSLCKNCSNFLDCHGGKRVFGDNKIPEQRKKKQPRVATFISRSTFESSAGTDYGYLITGTLLTSSRPHKIYIIRKFYEVCVAIYPKLCLYSLKQKYNRDLFNVTEIYNEFGFAYGEEVRFVCLL